MMLNRKSLPRLLMIACLVAIGLGAARPAAAADQLVDRTLCVFDPIGANGFIYQSMKKYVTAALNWGVRFHPKPYSNEAVAASDFKAGHCDAIEMTGNRNILFVKFAGSLDMAGGLQTYKAEHLAIKVMSSPAAAKYMRQGPYETVGVAPGGKVFLYSQTKEGLASLKKAAGKKIAVMSFDEQASTLVNVVGATPVPSSIATFGPKFNNGSVDYAYAPSFAYKALELYKGLGKKGGIADFVLAHLSLQIDIRWKRFPDGFGQKSRQWVLHKMWQPGVRRDKQYDAAIPDHYWVHINKKRSKKYRRMFRETRQRLWEKNWYSHKMQRLLKKIRCKFDPTLAECSMDTEGGPVG